MVSGELRLPRTGPVPGPAGGGAGHRTQPNPLRVRPVAGHPPHRRKRVGGAGVALGCLGQEELTARRFVPYPFADGTLYPSGDPGRLRPDGRLEHFGRIDGQVKIGDFRIELDEIRAVLLEDPRRPHDRRRRTPRRPGGRRHRPDRRLRRSDQ
nr:AMP-binding protein [Streptomyces sp. DSM 40750]